MVNRTQFPILVCFGIASLLTMVSTAAIAQSNQPNTNPVSASVELSNLKSRAAEVASAIGLITANSKGDLSQDVLAQIQKCLDELKNIRARVDIIEKWIISNGKTPPAPPTADPKAPKFGLYIQTQYRDTNKVGGSNDAFSLRRVRLGATMPIDPKLSIRMSAELASGTTTNTTLLKDAWARMELSKPNGKAINDVQFGQMNMPLGFELERSSADREFPEYTAYNRTFWSGESARGFNSHFAINSTTQAQIGAWNALAQADPEQSTVAPGPQNRLGVSAGVRHFAKDFQVGISGFAGERPSIATTYVDGGTITVNHPRVDREFIYADLYVPSLFRTKAFLRGEAMWGQDRIPLTPGANQSVQSPRLANKVNGGQVQLGYQLDPKNQANIRWDQFDPNTSSANDVQTTWGFAFAHYLHANARVTLAHEITTDNAISVQKKFHATTLRATFKF